MTAVLLKAGRYEAAFRPDCAMLCTSLQFRGKEYVAWPRPISQFRAGNATAIPPLHPWSNRLGRWNYTAAGRRVNLRGLTLPTDQNGLPIHGNLFGVAFDVARADDTHVVARLDYSAYREKLRAFPFPHVFTIDARLHPDRGLTITTEVRPTGQTAVPVSFGWHPYVKLPVRAGARADWELRWPACDHVEVDKHTIPTGTRTPQAVQQGPIARRTFDDHYALRRDRRFWIAGEGHSLMLRFDGNYPFAQLFVPPRKQLVAIEPMTATIDALGAGTAPLVEPGDRFRAAFSLQADAGVS